MARSRVRLGDVARHAGVSRTTVSYVINGRSQQMRIAPETQERVRRAIDDLGYRPSQLARNLRTKKTRTIGVITDEAASGVYSSPMLLGASRIAAEHGYLLMIAETGGDPVRAAGLVEEFADRHLDHTIVATVITQRLAVPGGLDLSRTTFLNCADPELAATHVLPDERAGGRLAADRLLAAGVTGGVWVLGDHSVPEALSGPLRLTGLRERLAEDGVEVSGVLRCGWDVLPARDAVTRWLERDPRGGAPVQALVALNDRIAFGAYQALADAGLRPGREVSVISFDGSELAGWVLPRLVSVRMPYFEMGEQAVRTVLLDPAQRPVRTLVPMPLVEGESVCAARG